MLSADALRRLSPAALLAVIAFPSATLFLFALAGDLSFFHDDWEFLVDRSFNLDGLLTPWFGHAVAVPRAIWHILIETFGTDSYWPFLVVLWLAHAAVAAAVFLIARSHVPDTWAVGVALVMAVLGSGSDNIFWAFQVSMVGATALGLFALWMAPRRPGAAASLLTVAVLSQGVGLAFLCGTAVHLLLARPRAVAWLLIPAFVWGTWYVVYGNVAQFPNDPPSANLGSLPGFVALGATFAMAGVLGTQVPAVGAAALAATAVLRPRLGADQVALLISALTFFVMAGLIRGSQTVMQPRYVYVVAPALLVLGASALSRLRFERHLGIALLTFALVGNVGLLISGHQSRLGRERCEEAHIPTTERMLPDGARPYAC